MSQKILQVPTNLSYWFKKTFIITARGDFGFEPGERNEKLNHQNPYLRTIFGFIGITNITFIKVENEEFGGTSLAH